MLLLAVVVATLVALTSETAEARRRCSRKDRACCKENPWDQAEISEEKFEMQTGCRAKCCKQLSAPKDAPMQSSRRGVARQNIISNLVSCITEILLNLANFMFRIPEVCCSIPPVSFFPVCGKSGMRKLARASERRWLIQPRIG